MEEDGLLLEPVPAVPKIPDEFVKKKGLMGGSGLPVVVVPSGSSSSNASTRSRRGGSFISLGEALSGGPSIPQQSADSTAAIPDVPKLPEAYSFLTVPSASDGLRRGRSKATSRSLLRAGSFISLAEVMHIGSSGNRDGNGRDRVGGRDRCRAFGKAEGVGDSEW
jgi:hypothetical protein